jgi:hypothetical protein
MLESRSWGGGCVAKYASAENCSGIVQEFNLAVFNQIERREEEFTFHDRLVRQCQDCMRLIRRLLCHQQLGCKFGSGARRRKEQGKDGVGDSAIADCITSLLLKTGALMDP